MAEEVALVVGAGPGLGLALVKRFAAEGMRVAAAARSGANLASAAGWPGSARAYTCDASDGDEVARLFQRVAGDLGAPDVVVFNAGVYEPASILDIAAEDFARCWRIGCFGGFLVGQAAAR